MSQCGNAYSTDKPILQCHFSSALIRDRVMHPNTSVGSVNEHC